MGVYAASRRPTSRLASYKTPAPGNSRNPTSLEVGLGAVHGFELV